MSNTIDVAEMDGRIQALVAQRDNANNQVVILQGQLNKALIDLKESQAKQADVPQPTSTD